MATYYLQVQTDAELSSVDLASEIWALVMYDAERGAFDDSRILDHLVSIDAASDR